MLNKEKYAKEIISVAEKGRRIALVDGKVVACEDIDCNNCEWGGMDDCREKLKKWMNSEHVEKPKLARKERQFCELVKTTGWIARNESGHLCLHNIKPIKSYSVWLTNESIIIDVYFNLDFDFIKWEDEEPWSVEDLLKLEVEE